METGPLDILGSEKADADLKAKRAAQIGRLIALRRAQKPAPPAPNAPARSAAEPEWPAARIANNLRIRQAREMGMGSANPAKPDEHAPARSAAEPEWLAARIANNLRIRQAREKK